MDTGHYLQRIGYRGPTQPSLETLCHLHPCHLLSVPFESLGIHCKELIVLDLPLLYDKIIRRHRGGFCFELNGLFLWLLQVLGFDAKAVAGRVQNRFTGRYGPPLDHMVILVQLDGQRLLCDVGFGEGFMEPLELKLATEQVQEGGTKQKGLQNLTKGIREQPFPGWAPATGSLQEVLRQPEYYPYGDAPMFEGTFVQVTKRGEYVGIHDQPNVITMGVLASSPSLLLPDQMIMAQVKKGVKITKAKVKDLEITRLIPLHLVKIFVHNVDERQLKVKLATGQIYYLQLCAPKGDENFLFERWIRLAYMLHEASGRISAPVSFTSKESGLHTIRTSARLRATSEKIFPRKGESELNREERQADVSVAAGPSEVGAKSMAAGPSRPTSQPAQMTSEKPAAAVAPSEPGSRGQESAAHSQTANVKSQEPSKAQSTRPQTPSSRSPKKGRSTSWSPSRKEKKSGLQVHRTTASVAVGPSQQGWKTVGVGPSMVVGLITSRPQSGALGTDKESKELAKQIQPSSAAGKQEPPRSQMSKNKLKKALSSARQTSSLTFGTIYSVLSSSMEKLKLSKSREDSKVAVKPSKRVTISGVIGPSGKSVPEEKKEEEEAGNPELHTVDNLRMDAGSSAAAMMGTDTDRPPPQSHASMGEGAPEAKSPAVGGGNSEAAEFSRPGSQIIAREPGVANVTSQKSDQIKDVGQPSTPRLEDQGCQVSGFLLESQGKRGRLRRLKRWISCFSAAPSATHA
ncbi:Golgi-associated RAB2 interactor protein 3-like isoform X2 [Rhineura floridana]|uniref:Golgi-associated RAB2 interactor protein 3-like isoform X2 n=1 Tax=Rhineura floridana TaxID=261503 RepID=UPI002AC879BF|nr:Golgi-associated RAB2 interactor protein 3-like isoform X2 [Rhineura floridana]XP_061440276.1 Golgi-associated RAB2 interactor protein 3-like isoform X2 [Rhineura floridana]